MAVISSDGGAPDRTGSVGHLASAMRMRRAGPRKGDSTSHLTKRNFDLRLILEAFAPTSFSSSLLFREKDPGLVAEVYFWKPSRNFERRLALVFINKYWISMHFIQMHFKIFLLSEADNRLAQWLGV